MSDKPREWPNTARQYRDAAAMAAAQGIHALTPVVTADRPLTETERLRREATALHSLHTIAQAMQAAGASKPEV